MQWGRGWGGGYKGLWERGLIYQSERPPLVDCWTNLELSLSLSFISLWIHTWRLNQPMVWLPMYSSCYYNFAQVAWILVQLKKRGIFQKYLNKHCFICRPSHCVGGCWDWTKDFFWSDFGIGGQTVQLGWISSTCGYRSSNLRKEEGCPISL